MRDGAFFDNVAPDSAGTLPGGRESMLIHGGALYVGSADGFVSKFTVQGAKQSLLRVGQSRRLGHEAFAMAVVGDGGGQSLVVGTRRHLHRLALDTLSSSAPVLQPWEVAQPHHLAWGDFLPGHPGKEVVCASVHGGLVFCDENTLVPFFEWPEPGIVDFVVQGPAIVLLSARGVVAKVTFDSSNVPTLHAVSQPIPIQLRQYGAAAEPPCQGDAIDLELMILPGAEGDSTLHAISLWTGDTDNFGVRMHRFSNLAVRPRPSSMSSYLSSSGPTDVWLDIASCQQAAESGTQDTGRPGDHCLVLDSGSRLMLFDENGAKRAEKSLTQTTQPGVAYSFGAQAHTLCVGELVANPGAQYPQEVVVATNTGLMWLHIDDLLAPGTALPAVGNAQGEWVSGYWLDTESVLGVGADTHVQPRTNRSMACSWAMARRPGGSGLDGDLHVLDQRGNYWKIGHAGNTRLYRSGGPAGARGWDYVGAVSSGFPASSDRLAVPLPGLDALAVTDPWSAKEGGVVVFENASGHVHRQDNWGRREYWKGVFDGFLVHRHAGSLAPTPTGKQAWMWSADGIPVAPGAAEDWGNLVEGLRLDTTGAIDGIWASTNDPAGGAPPSATTADRCRYRRLRTNVTATTIQMQQAAEAVALDGAHLGETAVVLGCPGGRVRVLHVLSNDWRVDEGTDHAQSTFWSGPDLGFGGSALAVRSIAGAGGVDIWFGTLNDPAARPQAYGDPLGTGALAYSEVAAGAVHRLSWQPGQNVVLHQTVELHPTVAQPRGGYAVTGLCVADLLPNTAGDELIVATMAGDLIVLSANDITQEIWRTRVDGSIGFYNGLRVDDLNNDMHKELYVAGSKGLWRFTTPMEGPSP